MRVLKIIMFWNVLLFCLAKGFAEAEEADPDFFDIDEDLQMRSKRKGRSMRYKPVVIDKDMLKSDSEDGSYEDGVFGRKMGRQSDSCLGDGRLCSKRDECCPGLRCCHSRPVRTKCCPDRG